MSAPSGRRSVSIIVCTYARSRLAHLGRLVAALEGQRRPGDEVIVVVDHNDDLLAELRASFGSLTVVANQDERGLSGGRNTGLALAARDIVAFIDDDAVPAPDWLDRLAAAYDDPLVVGAGGAVEPDWETAAPPWFPPEFGWVVGCGYRGQPADARPVRNFIGCNMSFRRVSVAGGEGFRIDLGRVGLRPVGCEETEFCIRLTGRRPGALLWFDPEARVDHFVPRDRMTWAYFRSRCYSEGLSKALVSRVVGAGSALASERSYVSRTLTRAVASNLLAAARGDRGALRRAGAIVFGLAATAAGYAIGVAGVAISRPHRAPARSEVAVER